MNDYDYDTGVEIVNALATGVKVDPTQSRILAIVQAAQRAYYRDGIGVAGKMLGDKADEYQFSDVERQWLRDAFMKALFPKS